MNYDVIKTLCLGSAAAAVLFAFAGCRTMSLSAGPGKPVPDQVTSITVPIVSDPGNRAGPSVTETEKKDGEEPETSGKFAEEGTINGLKYKVTAAPDPHGATERGYYVYGPEKQELSYSILISAGEFNTGGHDIGISGIAYDGKTLTITVFETAPKPGDAVTEAFTYPCCAVRFNKLPENIRVVSGSSEFKCLHKSDAAPEKKTEWFAVIENGSGEIMHKTYVYDLGDGRYRFEHVTATTTRWGSAHWKEVVNGSGTADSREEVVEEAKKFGSCGFVIYAGENKAHSVSEFIADKK